VRTDSTLAAISDKDFERGMSRINQEVAAEPEPQAVISKLDPLVLKARL
jgi:hypothetical protein